ncbi:MAG TPA: DUF4178 domain-containing protein [Coleofasciculaceae cyanobacterium]|jgi:hypothetical protein
MLSSSNVVQLQQLRPGDRVKYHGSHWRVKNHSTYIDPKGYETTEWLLRSSGGSEYYLLREFDPQNPEGLVHWYLAEEISNPKIFQPNCFDNLAVRMWHDMQGEKTPYPELEALSRHYYFESQTQGTYQGNQEYTSRITWDYWDEAHQWNLAIEAWSNTELHVYSTKVVKPEKFSDIETGKPLNFLSSFPIWEFMGACCFLIVGILMVIFG